LYRTCRGAGVVAANYLYKAQSACNKWRVVSVIERIEKDHGKPVVSNTQAWVWEALRLMNMATPIPGYGRLLSEFK